MAEYLFKIGIGVAAAAPGKGKRLFWSDLKRQTF
jgi:hypothetical protein